MIEKIDVVLVQCESLPDVDGWLVLDLLRASSQMVTFFSLGGRWLYPVVHIDDALVLKKTLGDGCLLMGERGGVPPCGFDRGNSPTELIRCGMDGASEGIICTSNGTAALWAVRQTGVPVWVASALNAAHACRMVSDAGSRIGILCAGNQGRAMLDDALCAGMLAERLLHLAALEGGNPGLSDGAVMVIALWREMGNNLVNGVSRSSHARFLRSKGFGADVDYCCQLDTINLTPCLGEREGVPVLYCAGALQPPV